MPKVLIAPREVAKFADKFRAPLDEAGLEVVALPPAEANLPAESELIAALHGVEAVIAGSEAYNPRVFAANPQLRVIARVGVGYDAVDLAAATAAGVAVTIAPGTNQGSVAEHAFALMLGFTRHIPARHAALSAGGWNRLMSLPLRGRTLGLAGLGRIGKAVATRARAFEMRVIAFDPFPDAAFCAATGVELVPFERLLGESDFLSLHLPLTPETRHVIRASTIAVMKPGAVLVNTSRGGLVREADLVPALQSGRLGGALLDVFEDEPTPADNPLRALPNVVLTPHAAGVDTQSLEDMARSAAEAIASLRRGEWPTEKVVNPAVQAAFRW
ncbi:D-3-phosphoglycerate dehydrogenase [Gemmata obscuriglobus]|uniref:phosphoglycerate dehydrogenase n=1 Tax=Gemmata obscuriglobus TaxID=114 RepID=UPI00016C4FF9|nr:phosphoglycerate dehydrogenase [Gemmata obscuriglobus]QEG26604.1 D-3-phosphoglycerate dehydrogenase [Gemmata obscuriglobus]VTS02101.1 phosphoglycerate dehydrogenase : Lactate dehydrogenase-like oxidoreductase OS=Singulisphaera acidiphila (strain ATCC BAA-1392 / DSM 18658 / VKM B-2454 / MOB10) GN=Sinac_3563 PE=3 SV=1: 2-Hacid_dh: 2-Hacid_dh_C [Gemmata obscuriglobus UQM 2246]